jgi:hypothetical protein
MIGMSQRDKLMLEQIHHWTILLSKHKEKTSSSGEIGNGEGMRHKQLGMTGAGPS